MVRNLRPDDIAVLKRIHLENGTPYDFPDLLSEQFVDVQVVVDLDDVPIMAIASRKTVEEYLLVDHRWRTPRWRMAVFVELHESVRLKLKELGFFDTHCWPYPEIEKSFARRLAQFGWIKSEWTCYWRLLG